VKLGTTLAKVKTSLLGDSQLVWLIEYFLVRFKTICIKFSKDLYYENFYFWISFQQLVAQVQGLHSKLEALQSLALGTDDSDDDEDDDDDEVLEDENYVKVEDLTSTNSPTKVTAKEENKVRKIHHCIVH